MPNGPFGGPRPGSSSILELVIKETPVPVEDDTGVFPDRVIRMGADEEDIIDDISGRTVFSSNDLSIDRKTSFMRGMGQTDTWTIRANVSGMAPESISNAVDKLVSAGYQFVSVEME